LKLSTQKNVFCAIYTEVHYLPRQRISHYLSDVTIKLKAKWFLAQEWRCYFIKKICNKCCFKESQLFEVLQNTHLFRILNSLSLFSHSLKDFRVHHTCDDQVSWEFVNWPKNWKRRHAGTHSRDGVLINRTFISLERNVNNITQAMCWLSVYFAL
jgi:hypothetical protein